MPTVKREMTDGYIVVHHLYSDRDTIEFLRGVSRPMLEKLCETAKREGETTFQYKDKNYVIIRNPDSSFSVYLEDERPSGASYL